MSARPLKFALIQSGCCVFGVGHTYRGCLLDAGKSMDPDESGRFTPQRIENELIASPSQRVDGSFYVIESGDDEFDSYLKNQGGVYKSSRGNWYPLK